MTWASDVIGAEHATSPRSSVLDSCSLVWAKRAAGVSDSAIARMIGVNPAELLRIPSVPAGVEAGHADRVTLSRWQGPARANSMAAILAGVATKHGLTVAEMKGPGRARRVAWPRQEAMWLIYLTGRYSRPQIGRFLGNRDHTTVLHGCREHEKRMAQA